MYKIILFVVACALLSVAGGEQTYGQKREKREQKEREISQLIESRQFRFVAQAALPLSGPRVDLTSMYDITVDSTMIESWLPFFGVAYRVEYGDRDGGIKFRQEADKIEVDFNKKKKVYNIAMDVKTEKDSYRITINAGLSGYAHVNVSSLNRQSIGFYGTIQPVKEAIHQ